ncbi:hypothetical protein LZ318_36605 [Saccharopolyspora indica]|uniref:TenA family protein n=1 Tax=Saccharopolyspora indica TaxID=1229659 RepID=UPI0022EAE732|nr:hypothetical protein [Saccharopolyspora indica]MDA3647679.1 hypothetical protein [Saccharopolyspora indica]
MIRDELRSAAEPVLKQIKEHPYWEGLGDGSLPGPALGHFILQDAHHLLPALARGSARCAAIATDDSHSMLLSKFSMGALQARNGMMMAFGMLAPRLGLQADGTIPPIDPATHAYASFFNAASAESLAAGLGALLPCSWFHIQVADDLQQRHDPASKYAMWVKGYHPGDEYRQVLDSFLNVVDEVAERCSPAEREKLVENFTLGARYEWLFAEAAWQLRKWPV